MRRALGVACACSFGVAGAEACASFSSGDTSVTDSGAPDVLPPPPPTQPDATSDAAPDASSFCATQDAAIRFCEDFDEGAMLDSRWTPGLQEKVADASLAVVDASITSPPNALRVDLLSPDATFPVRASYYVNHVETGMVMSRAVTQLTFVVDALGAIGDAGSPTVDGRLFTYGDSAYTVEVDVGAIATGATSFSLSLFENYSPGGFESHDYEFDSVTATVGQPHAIRLEVDYAARAVTITLDGVPPNTTSNAGSFHVPSFATTPVLALGTKTDRPNTHLTIRYDDVLLDLH